MKSRYTHDHAEATVARYEASGVASDVALRVYTTRLLGQEPDLVLHGGGNSSVKTVAADAAGVTHEVLCVKGSGWDMATIEPDGLPAVRLEPLRRLRELDRLGDEQMVNLVRGALIRPDAPTPSVETLLHAFMEPAFIDHTHACAILSLTDQPDGEAVCRAVLGDSVVIVPYIMPGFDLARAAVDAYETRGRAVAMILLKHGLVTWGTTALESYQRTIDVVTRAQQWLEKRRPVAAVATTSAAPGPGPGVVAPLIRGAVCRGAGERRFVLDFRHGPAVMAYVNDRACPEVSRRGVVTPDHVIRTKPQPMWTGPVVPWDAEAFGAEAAETVERFAAEYRAYYQRNNVEGPVSKIALDPLPRVVLVPGLGLFGVGATARDAAITADVAVSAIGVIRDAEMIGVYEPITESQTFQLEYWSLEQAKLATAAPRALAGHVVVITGGAGTIGLATAHAFARRGAEVAILDRDAAAAESSAGALGGIGLGCDVTSADDVDRCFERICATFGGVDVVVSNAGAAWQGPIGEVDDADLRASFELNFFAHQNVARRAAAIMRGAGTGGSLLFNVSKQAVNPGPRFGPYGVPKAATMALLRQYAVDYGDQGIRSNGVNADRIPSGMLGDDLIDQRANARGVSREAYLAGNLLRRQVTEDDVAEAFVFLALAPTTTGCVLSVDGGNIAAALR